MARDGARLDSTANWQEATSGWTPPEPLASDLPAEPDLREQERALRDRIAGDADPTDAVLDLAAMLCANERLDEALVVVRDASGPSRDPVLRVAKAGILRDLGQRHLAAQELRTLRREQGDEALHPGLLFELAEIEWLEGNAGAARAVLAEVARVHGESAWVVAHQRELAGLGAELDQHAAPQRVRVRDLLGNLRGAPDAGVRMRVLEWLAARPTAEPGSDGEPDALRDGLRARAVAIACGDESAAVRARAVQLASPEPEAAEAFCRAALDDDDAFVRAVAATRCVELLQRDAVPLLLARIDEETVPSAFSAAHEALTLVVPAPPRLALGDADTAAGRAKVAAAWRERWPH